MHRHSLSLSLFFPLEMRTEIAERVQPYPEESWAREECECWNAAVGIGPTLQILCLLTGGFKNLAHPIGWPGAKKADLQQRFLKFQSRRWPVSGVSSSDPSSLVLSLCVASCCWVQTGWYKTYCKEPNIWESCWYSHFRYIGFDHVTKTVRLTWNIYPVFRN